jgi:hypothetical protein
MVRCEERHFTLEFEMAIGSTLKLRYQALATALVGAALISFAPAANASTYDFIGSSSPSGSPVTVDLDITTGGSEGSHSFAITSVTGWVVVGGNSDAVTLLGLVDAPPSYYTSPDGAWYYDNVLYPSLLSPYGTAFDNPGLLLLDNVTGNDINIFSPGSGGAPYTLGTSPNQVQGNLYGTLTATPLPQTLSLITGGIGLIGFVTRRKRKNRAARLELAA